MDADLVRELRKHKLRSVFRVLLGIVLITVGVMIRVPVAGFMIALVGAVICGRNFARLIRISAAEQNVDWFRTYNEFHRATLPRQLYVLLLAVAEVDGRAGDAERDMVRKFVLERFADPVTAQDLASWEVQRVPPSQIGVLAGSLRRILSPAERETVFFWSSQITFADGKFRSDEHQALHAVARGLGIRASHARVIFQHAKARFLGAGETWGRTSGESSPGPRIPAGRKQAIATLGLEGDPSRDEIRDRHRELVKQYHPDAHSHLGPVAAEEAEKRFREIQAAYELLTET